MNDFETKNKTVETVVVNGYHKLQDSVVGVYNKVQDTVVNGYLKTEDFFVEHLFTQQGETVEEAKMRLKQNNLSAHK